MSVKDKYKLGPLCPTLLELVHERPQLVVLHGNMYQKGVDYAAMLKLARAQKADLQMGDVVQFVCQLRKDVKKGVVPKFIATAELAKFFDLKGQFEKQAVADRAAGKRFTESRPSTILGRCQKHLLLSLLQTHRKVLEAPNPGLLDEIALGLERHGFTLTRTKIASFVATVKKALQKSKLPSFVGTEDHSHYQDLLDDFAMLVPATPLRRSTRKAAKKTHFSPVPTTNSTRKQKATTKSPATTPVKSGAVAKDILGGLKEGHKIVVMRQLVASGCAVLLPGRSPPWRQFLEDLWQVDATISEKQAKGFLKRLKQRYIRDGVLPSFSPEAAQVFNHVQWAYDQAFNAAAREKTDIAVGRFIIGRLPKIPELVPHQLPADLSTPHLVKLAKDVSKVAGRETTVEYIHGLVQSWKRAYRKNQLPSFISKNKKHTQAIMRITADRTSPHHDDSPLFAVKPEFATPPYDDQYLNHNPYLYNPDCPRKEKPVPTAPPGSPNDDCMKSDEMDDYDDDMGSVASGGSSLWSTSSATSSNYSLGGFSDWDSATESDNDDWDDLFNPFREVAAAEAAEPNGEENPVPAPEQPDEANDIDFISL